MANGDAAEGDVLDAVGYFKRGLVRRVDPVFQRDDGARWRVGERLDDDGVGEARGTTTRSGYVPGARWRVRMEGRGVTAAAAAKAAATVACGSPEGPTRRVSAEDDDVVVDRSRSSVAFAGRGRVAGRATRRA